MAIGENHMSNKVDLYTSIHKGQRDKFFKIAMHAGSIDYADQKSLDKIHDELNAFKDHMHLHASLEERFIHPLLSSRVPGGARKLEDDHREMRQQLDDLINQFDGIRTKFVGFEKRDELALEFYRAWNRFISFYFAHIDYEEERAQPALWELCTNEELATTFKTILTSQAPQELRYNFEMMLPALSLKEAADIINKGRTSDHQKWLKQCSKSQNTP